MNVNTLKEVLRGLMTIPTRGNDTIVMSNCLQELNKYIQQNEEIQNGISKEVEDEQNT